MIHRTIPAPSILLLLPLRLLPFLAFTCSFLLLHPTIPTTHAFSWPNLGSTRGENDKRECVRTMKAVGYSSSSYPANNPIEDRHIIVDEQTSGYFSTAQPLFHAAVFDGHGGAEVAEMVKTNLVAKVKEVIARIPEKAQKDEAVITNALINAFIQVETKWIDSVMDMDNEYLQKKKATIGACGLYALIKDSTLYVANAGDCRAVMGKLKNPNYTPKPPKEGEEVFKSNTKSEYEAIPMSLDHNSREEREQARLREAHPGEDQDIVLCYHSGHACYVKGRLQPSRAFGDIHLKLEDFGPEDEDIPWTPPYLTAVPEVASVALNRMDHFLVLGSDGLWDVFSNDEVVDLVAEYRKEGKKEGEIATLLTDAALARVATSLKMTVEELKKVPQGSERRRRHDDITVVVLFFQEQRQGDCPLPGTEEYELEVVEEDEDFDYPEEEGEPVLVDKGDTRAEKQEEL